jgi:hypothetical protein
MQRMAAGRGEILHVGEKKKGVKDEFVFVDPGSDGMAVVAPRREGQPADVETAMTNILQQVTADQPRRLRKAQSGAIVDPQVFQGSQLLMSLLSALQQMGPQLATDMPRVQAGIFDMLGFAAPSLFGITDPAKFRSGLSQAVMGKIPTTPTISGRAQAMAEQQLRTNRELRGLAPVPGAGQIPAFGGMQGI